MGDRVEERGSQSRVQSVDRAMMLLEALGGEEDGNRLIDLAHKTGLAPSTVHRILTTLEERQFIQFNPNDRMWHIGRQAFAIGSVFTRKSNLVATALPYLRRLRDQTRETANLGFIQDGELVFADRVESRDISRTVTHVGGRMPMMASAMGKAILATFRDEDLAAVMVREGGRRFTFNTLMEPEGLQAELERIRRDGYSVDDEEFVPGVRCVASAIYDHHGEAIGAISLSSLTTRITPQRVPALGRLLVETSDQLTNALNGAAPAVKASDL